MASVAAKAVVVPQRVRVSPRIVSSTARAASRGVATAAAADASAAKKKVVVIGGSGFIGRRVCARLAALGANVTSVSKSGAAVEGSMSSTAIDLSAEASVEALMAALEGADAAVSCVGVLGGGDETMRIGNGVNNVRAIECAKAAGVKRFVYVSVASIVPEVVGATPLMKGYFEGKTMAEEALAANFDEGDYCVVKPSFVYGGDEFSLNPPRVTKAYGDILVKLLGAGFVKSIAEKTPGPIRLTLAEPVSVDDVAGACAAGAMVRTGEKRTLRMKRPFVKTFPGTNDDPTLPRGVLY